MANSDTLLDPVEIPVALDVPLYTQRVVLDEREYVLRLDWNGRESRWYLGIATVDGRDLYRGVKLVADWPLLRRLVDPDAPKGLLVARDKTGKGEAPAFGDLGRRVFLLYYPFQLTAVEARVRKARVLHFRKVGPLFLTASAKSPFIYAGG